MELTHLQTFLAVYRLGTFTAAAEALYISQPSVTQHIKALESQLGRPLFLRLPRGVAPTPVAHALATDVSGPLDVLQATSSSFRAGADLSNATVVVGGPADCLAAKVLPALVSLTTAGLQVRTRIGLTKPLIDELADGAIDVVVATAPTRARGVNHVPLFTETLVLVASPLVARQIDRARLHRRDPSALTDLALIAYDDSVPLVRRYWRAVFPGSAPPPPRLVIADLRAMVDLVRHDGGISVVPSYLAADALRSGTIVQLLDPNQPPTNQLTLAVRTDARLGHITAVVNHLTHVAAHW
jgi:DNA-binding transcriptional LysR family regulator